MQLSNDSKVSKNLLFQAQLPYPPPLQNVYNTWMLPEEYSSDMGTPRALTADMFQNSHAPKLKPTNSPPIWGMYDRLLTTTPES